jgi:hypothetical protein
MSVTGNMMSAEAGVLRCGYEAGYFQKADITRWADRYIAELPEPCIELLDLSMIRETPPSDVVKLLQALESLTPSAIIEARIGFVGLLRNERALSTRAAVRGLFPLAREPGTTADQKSEIYSLDDAYDLATARIYGTMEEVEKLLASLVGPYSRRLAEQYPDLIPSLGPGEAEQSLAAESR